jgi:CRISPR/Cas system-associated exonuclease Cas4 (RecB family)
MKAFLQRLAEEIATRFSDDPGQLCVVLPNRRAGLYLKKYLANELKKTSWAPLTYSVEDFITTLSGFKIIDPAGLLFEFYHVYRNINGADAQDFDVFADWAQALLKDFEEIDQYLADPEKIFTYLDAARALSVWNLNETPLTIQEKDYLKFYRSFLDYYRGLKARLEEKKLVYPGLAYRKAAEDIERLSSSQPWKFIFFAGLNALSAAEETIIDHLVKQKKAEVFWDIDEYYINDPIQEAGFFIREYLNKWPADPQKWIENDFRLAAKTIQVFGIPGSMGQAQKASQLINEMKSDRELPDKTALVLSDEKLLLPALYSLPENIGPVNVTMGYPFKYTHLYHLASMLFQMQENAEKLALQRKSAVKSFYIKDVLKVLSHPYLIHFTPAPDHGQVSFENISASLRKKNRVFLVPVEILRYSAGSENVYNSINKNLFSTWETPVMALDGLLRTIEMIRDQMIECKPSPANDRSVDLEYLFHLSKIIKRCRTMMETYPFIQDLKTLRKILFQVMDASRLPFSGEPLQGLQVMGVLETRAIDFENLVVLSVNEGILPSGRMPNSFIPFDIKNEFGLPTFRHNDAVFAYHFYRMMQRAGNIYLLYDTEGDQMKGGEKSRYITQVGYELVNYNPKVSYTESLLGPAPPAGTNGNAIIVKKTPVIMERLMEKAGKGFSPSSLNTYIRCPLQFYFQEILGLSEAENVEETVEAKTMGTVIHQVFQKVYKVFEGKPVDPEILAGQIDLTEKYLSDAFREHYTDGDLDYGKNHLIFKVSHFLVNEFISREVEYLNSTTRPETSLSIISLEKQFSHELKIDVKDLEVMVRFKGMTDRIDKLEDVTRVIDYKTGLVQAAELQLKSWDILTHDPKKGKAFQLLLYAWLLFKNCGDHHPRIQSGNISLRKISEGFLRVKLPDDQEINKESMAVFEELLKELAAMILDQDIPFTQTEDNAICTNCPFKSVCTR